MTHSSAASVFAMCVLGVALLLLPLMSPFVASVDNSWSAPSSADLQVLQLVNDYRVKAVGISALMANSGASCVGYQIAQRLQSTPCSNETGASTQYGENSQFSDFPNMLAACGVQLVNATSGYIAPDCVPGLSGDPSSAAQNFTRAQQYQVRVNDTSYTSAGVGSQGIWYVLVLATNSPDGNFGITPGFNEDIIGGQQQLQIPVVLGVVFVIVAALFGTAKW